MKYKEKIITHSENIENGINRIIEDIQANRLNKEEVIKGLQAISVKSEYLLNLVNLED
tara:strand:+ start:141 stop:314 length:174 start_codon:yes stop_codon:yes gene_type:complete